MKSWLKGGIIGVITSLLITLGIVIFAPAVSFLSLEFLFPNELCYFITHCSGEGCIACTYLNPLVMFIELFLIGVVIGWIVGKVKNRNEVKKK